MSAAVMLTFPNAVSREATAGYAYPRRGLWSRAERRGEVLGVRLGAEDPANVAETDRTEWVIAARGAPGVEASYGLDWDAAGDGADIAGALIGGRLGDRTLTGDGEPGGAGAVALTTTLDPGERAELAFCLAWDFPVVQFRDPVSGPRWAERYTEWFDGGYRGLDIATEVLSDPAGLEAAIDRWWAPVATDEEYPAWLRQAALNELYYDVFGGSFWENGCLSRSKRFGAREGQHLFGVLEADVYRNIETLDVRHYASRHRLALFPRSEADLLLAWADFIADDPWDRCPHDAGSPVNDPWFAYGQYNATEPGDEPRRLDWKDLPPRYTQLCHACWQVTGDEAFLAEVYPAAVRTMEHLMSFDADGDGLPENAGGDGFCEADTTYDDLALRGPSTLVATLTIGALAALADMAAALGRSDDAEAHQRAADRARAAAEATLWDPEGGYYRADTAGPYSEALMHDALCGQRFAEVYGLDDVLERDRMASHLGRPTSATFSAAGTGPSAP